MCSECGAYLATKHRDEALRKKTAAEWSKIYGVDVEPESVCCVGCIVSDGPHFQHCSECEIRACGQQKNVANCGRCPEYACERINGFFNLVPAARSVLDGEHNASRPGTAT